MLMMFMYHRILPYEHPQGVSTSQFKAQSWIIWKNIILFLLRKRSFLISEVNGRMIPNPMLPSPMFFWPWGHYSTAGLETVKEMGLLQFTVSKGVISRGSTA